MVAQVYKFIRLQELDIQKSGGFLPVEVQVLIPGRTECFIAVLVRINQLPVYHLTERSIHKIRQFNKEVS